MFAKLPHATEYVGTVRLISNDHLKTSRFIYPLQAFKTRLFKFVCSTLVFIELNATTGWQIPLYEFNIYARWIRGWVKIRHLEEH